MDGDKDPLNPNKSDEPVDRFQKIRAELEAMQLPEFPDDEQLQAKIPLLGDSQVRPQFPDAPQVTITRKNPAQNTSSDKNLERTMGRGIAAGYSLFAAIVAFGIIGWLISHTTGVGVGVIVGAIVGLGLCIRLLNQP